MAPTILPGAADAPPPKVGKLCTSSGFRTGGGGSGVPAMWWEVCDFAPLY